MKKLWLVCLIALLSGGAFAQLDALRHALESEGAAGPVRVAIDDGRAIFYFDIYTQEREATIARVTGALRRFQSTLGQREKPTVVLMRSATGYDALSIHDQTISAISDSTALFGFAQRVGWLSAPHINQPPALVTNGCVSHTSPNGSTMTCYNEGKVVSQIVCVTHADFSIDCRSTYDY